jgi:hypothetical protein
MEQKTDHYRNVMKSNHLSVPDLEDMIEGGTPLIFTIKEVKQEFGVSVAGKIGNFNICYFVDDIKPLVLNATNGKRIREFAPKKSPFVSDWAGIVIELYIDDKVKFAKDIVGGVRVKIQQPTKQQPTKKTLSDERLQDAIIAINKCEFSKDVFLSKYELTDSQTKTLEENV